MNSHITEQLRPLFQPESVAVIGASNNPAKWGFGVFNDLMVKGFGGKLYPVTRSEKEVTGVTAYGNVKDIPDPVDLAIIVIPAQYVVEAMKDCVQKGVRAAVIISAGFAEVGGQGKELQNEVTRIAREGGIRFVGPNCFGIVNTGANLSSMGLLSPYSMPRVPKGPIGIISQSGNAGGFVLQLGYQRGLGFSKFVSTGNEADLHFEDYFEYLSNDPETKVIVGYLEGLREGRRFFEVAKQTTTKKPVVMLKVGRTEAGSKAAHSHTGSLVGSESSYEAAFRQAGVIMVDEFEDLLDVAVSVIHQPIPKGNRIGVVTVAGGFGVMAVDWCEKRSLSLSQLTPETIQKLDTWLPAHWSRSNPVDLVGTLEKSYGCIGTVLKDENVDAVLAISSLGFPVGAGLEGYPVEFRERAQAYAQQMRHVELTQGVAGLLERIKRYQKPVIAGVGGSPPGTEESEAVTALRENGVVIYPMAERAVKVLSYMVQYGQYLERAD